MRGEQGIVQEVHSVGGVAIGMVGGKYQLEGTIEKGIKATKQVGTPRLDTSQKDLIVTPGPK